MVGPGPVRVEGWETGTALDEFIPIYLAMAPATALHGPMTPDQVDLLDISLVAALMGVNRRPVADLSAVAATRATPRTPKPGPKDL